MIDSTELKRVKFQLIEAQATLQSFISSLDQRYKNDPPNSFTYLGEEIFLEPDEEYICTVSHPHRIGKYSGYHLILVSDPDKCGVMSWLNANRWAEEQYGILPSAEEASMLRYLVGHRFKKSTYWTRSDKLEVPH